jgi:Asp-tRNA(Asn)/Glu-tRNA(Gln) amidotransferase B subunit
VTRKNPSAWCVPTWKKTRAKACMKTSLARAGIDLNRAGTPLLEIVTEARHAF